MKRTKILFSIILTLSLVFGNLTTNFAALSNTKADILDAQKSFEFSMTPKSKEWKKYSSLQLKEMLNIPLSTAEEMDTETLLKTVLDYPFMIDIYAFDNITQGVECLALEFNGAAVLMQRSDLAEKLQDIHKNTTEKMMAIESENNVSDSEIMQKMFIESLLTFPKVSDVLSQDEKDVIVERSQQVSDKFQTMSLTMGETSDKTANVMATTSEPGTVLSSGYVYTPLANKVLVYKLQELTSDDKTRINNQYDAAYPNATRLGTATYNYNCHSYALYYSSTSNKWWMNDPSKYMTEGSYQKVTTPKAGDRVYWSQTHSGVVTSVSGSNITVTSKWGAAGLYRHPINDCPYPIVAVKTFWRQ